MERRTLKNGLRFLIACALLLPALAAACPLCKDAIEGDPVAAAFNWTTFLMIGAPILLVTSIGGWVSYIYWRHAQQMSAHTESSNETGWWPAWTGKENET